MEQRDLIKDQIEQLGKVLATIMIELVGKKSINPAAIEAASKQLMAETGIDIEQLVSIDTEALHDHLAENKLKAEHMEILSEYLRETAERSMDANIPEAKRLLKRAIELLKIANTSSKTLSLERMSKINKIKSVLEKC